MSTYTFPTFGAAAEECLAHAVCEWRDEYARATAVDDLSALHVRRAELHYQEYPGGHATVEVRVVARKEWQSEIYWWRLRIVAGTWQIA
jgi:hypothetical protein